MSEELKREADKGLVKEHHHAKNDIPTSFNKLFAYVCEGQNRLEESKFRKACGRVARYGSAVAVFSGIVDSLIKLAPEPSSLVCKIFHSLIGLNRSGEYGDVLIASYKGALSRSFSGYVMRVIIPQRGKGNKTDETQAASNHLECLEKIDNTLTYIVNYLIFAQTWLVENRDSRQVQYFSVRFYVAILRFWYKQWITIKKERNGIFMRLPLFVGWKMS